MVILEVGMLSGLSLSPGAAVPADLIRKVERLPDKVILYLDSVSMSWLGLQYALQENQHFAEFLQHAAYRTT